MKQFKAFEFWWESTFTSFQNIFDTESATIIFDTWTVDSNKLDLERRGITHMLHTLTNTHYTILMGHWELKSKYKHVFEEMKLGMCDNNDMTSTIAEQ